MTRLSNKTAMRRCHKFASTESWTWPDPAGPRVTIYSRDPKAKRVEFRLTEHSWNPYLAFAAMLMAGIDGFHNRLYSLPPREPIEKLYDLPPQELAAPSSLNESLNAPEIPFLLHGDVFTRDVIEIHLSE